VAEWGSAVISQPGRGGPRGQHRGSGWLRTPCEPHQSPGQGVGGNKDRECPLVAACHVEHPAGKHRPTGRRDDRQGHRYAPDAAQGPPAEVVSPGHLLHRHHAPAAEAEHENRCGHRRAALHDGDEHDPDCTQHELPYRALPGRLALQEQSPQWFADQPRDADHAQRLGRVAWRHALVREVGVQVQQHGHHAQVGEGKRKGDQPEGRRAQRFPPTPCVLADPIGGLHGGGRNVAIGLQSQVFRAALHEDGRRHGNEPDHQCAQNGPGLPPAHPTNEGLCQGRQHDACEGDAHRRDGDRAPTFADEPVRQCDVHHQAAHADHPDRDHYPAHENQLPQVLDQTDASQPYPGDERTHHYQRPSTVPVDE
jgi:hypothetical protein